MILYHGSTAYHILCCIVHKLFYYRNMKAVLMITEYMAPKDELEFFINDIKERGWFEEILVVPEPEFRRKAGSKLTGRSDTEEIEGVVNKLNDILLDWYPAGFRQFDDAYIAADQWTVGTYYLSNKIPYYNFEDASGLLGDEKRYLKLMKESTPQNYILCEYLQAAGRNRIVKGKLCDMNNLPEGFYDEKAIDFSIYKTMCQMDRDTRMQIVSLYGGEMVPMPEYKATTVFLTQYYNNLKIREVGIQKKMTKLIIDYFAENSNLIIKPHPKDRYIPYEEIFPGCTVIKRSIPSEILPFMLPKAADEVITPNSTSIGGMRNCCQKVYLFGEEIEVHYERLHLYYAASKIIEAIYSGQELCYPNANSLFLNNFLDKLDINISYDNCSSNKIWLDAGEGYKLLEKDSESFSKEDTIIFLEVEEHYTLFWNEWINRENMIQLIVEVDDERGCREHVIWFYSKDKELREKVINMSFERELKNTGANIGLSAMEVTENMILEGKLEAMRYAMQKKENESNDRVLHQAAEIIEKYEEEKWRTEKVLMREGILPM